MNYNPSLASKHILDIKTSSIYNNIYLFMNMKEKEKWSGPSPVIDPSSGEWTTLGPPWTLFVLKLMAANGLIHGDTDTANFL